MKKLLLPAIILFFGSSSFSQATLHFTTCPNVNVGVVRAGTNADVQNPYYIYSVNTSTGAVTQFPGGPLLNPAAANQNLQVNAVGVNTTDGFMYGLETETTGNNPKFVRFDYGYGVTLLGGVVAPTSPTGFLGVVNTAAGDMDRNDNYYYTGVTLNPTAGGYSLDKLFLGKISGASTVAGAPVPAYYEIDYSDVNCGNYISTLSTDPINSGIKDITFNPVTNTFFIYATYKPTGAADFSGQLIELRPVDGTPLKYKMYCYPNVNSHTAETAGTLIDNAGNLLVLLTDGTVGKMTSAGAFTYTGGYVALNNTTGLPNPLRGDLAGCGGATGGPTPINLSSFKASTRDCKTNFLWSSANEINLSRYEVEQSTDNMNFTRVGVVNANNKDGSTYGLTIPAAGSMAYYRLKIIESDNTYSYSGIVAIRSSCTASTSGFALANNPVRDVIKLNWYGMNAGGINVKVYNSYGVLVLSKTESVPAGSSVMNINAGNLTPGVYIIKMFNVKTGEVMEGRFVKQ
jgi:hypothetical protein